MVIRGPRSPSRIVMLAVVLVNAAVLMFVGIKYWNLSGQVGYFYLERANLTIQETQNTHSSLVF